MTVEELYKIIVKTVFLGKYLYSQDKIRTYRDQHNLSYFQVTTLDENSAAIYKVYYQEISELARLSLEDFGKDSWKVFDAEKLVLGYNNNELMEYNHDIYVLMNKDVFGYVFFIENAYSENLEKVGYDFFSYIYCFAENWKLFESLEIPLEPWINKSFWYDRIKDHFLKHRIFYKLESGEYEEIEYKLLKDGNKQLICVAYYLGEYVIADYKRAQAVVKARNLISPLNPTTATTGREYNPEFDIPDEVDTSTDEGQQCLEEMNALMKAAIGKDRKEV